MRELLIRAEDMALEWAPSEAFALTVGYHAAIGEYESRYKEYDDIPEGERRLLDRICALAQEYLDAE